MPHCVAGALVARGAESHFSTAAEAFSHFQGQGDGSLRSQGRPAESLCEHSITHQRGKTPPNATAQPSPGARAFHARTPPYDRAKLDWTHARGEVKAATCDSPAPDGVGADNARGTATDLFHHRSRPGGEMRTFCRAPSSG